MDHGGWMARLHFQHMTLPAAHVPGSLPVPPFAKCNLHYLDRMFKFFTKRHPSLKVALEATYSEMLSDPDIGVRLLKHTSYLLNCMKLVKILIWAVSSTCNNPPWRGAPQFRSQDKGLGEAKLLKNCSLVTVLYAWQDILMPPPCLYCKVLAKTAGDKFPPFASSLTLSSNNIGPDTKHAHLFYKQALFLCRKTQKERNSSI